jgi:SAM-dependent methyltransferase
MNISKQIFNNVVDYVKFLSDYKVDSSSVDFCHNLLIFSTILSYKPQNILEVGYGSGFVTHSIIEAIKINNIGKLTLVDNWRDWNYKIPNFINNLDNNIDLITSEEIDFISCCNDNLYDIVVQDASHKNFNNIFHNYKRITKNKGIIFFHDSSMFDLNFIKDNSFVNFNKSTIFGERCDRGFLMFINNKL